MAKSQSEDLDVVTDLPKGVVLRGTSTDAVLLRSFLIAGFGIGSSKLKLKHEKALDDLAEWLQKNPLPERLKWYIQLTGRASKTGDDKLNMELSKSRCESAERFLAKKLGGIRALFQIVPLGESNPFDDEIQENTQDRSVRVRVAPVMRDQIIPVPEPVNRTPDLIKLAKKNLSKKVTWNLRVDGFTAYGVGVKPKQWWLPVSAAYQYLTMYFSVRDPSGGPVSTYTFEGSCFTAGLSLPGGRMVDFVRHISPGSPKWIDCVSTTFAKVTELEGIGEANCGAIGFYPNSFWFGGERSVVIERELRFPRVQVETFELPTASPPMLPSAFERYTGKVVRGKR